MAWNEQEAKRRVEDHDFHDFDVDVQELSKSMDFSNLGTRDVRRANAAHVYVDVPNFHLSVSDARADKAKQKKLIRGASVLRKVQRDLLKSPDIIGDYELGHIQFQAARLHALTYKPYADQDLRASNAVVMGITLNTYLYEVFNDVFDDLPRNLQSSVGISAGKCLIANIGFHGDRERICLGTPANLAAKVIGSGNTIRATAEVYALLPKSLADYFKKADEKVADAEVYEAKSLRWDTEPELARALGVTWNADKWKKRTEEYRDALPLDDMEVCWAEVQINIDALTERNSRRTDGVAIYADLDGFTRYVQDAEEDDSVVSLVRELHMIRHEFHAVLKKDYPGFVLQHQGDRVFAILHEPCGDTDADHEKRCRRAVDAAIGIQSSMQHVLRAKLTDRKDLYVAVGLDVGTALVTRLGKKGKREVVCLGPEVCEAERLQLKSTAKQIRISEAAYAALENAALKAEFKKEAGAYVATELTHPRLEEKEAEKAAKAGALGARIAGKRIEVVTNASGQSKPWSRH